MIEWTSEVERRTDGCAIAGRRNDYVCIEVPEVRRDVGGGARDDVIEDDCRQPVFVMCASCTNARYETIPSVAGCRDDTSNSIRGEAGRNTVGARCTGLAQIHR